MESGTAQSPPGGVGDSQSARKKTAIMEAATAAFLETGYVGTSVDEIAARAGVSKPTVYKHFGGKKQLFSEIVLRTIDQVGEPFFAWIGALDETEDLEAALGELARKLVAIVREPRLLELRRLVIGESARFPELGRTYFERGPGRTIDTLASEFERLADRGLLRVADPRLAAQLFNWLVLSIPLNRAMFSPDPNFDATELDRYADEAVRVFLAAYGQR
jgi:TetR/AcrR family transcriptional regulator, mexJK operon transcriptional repressor